MFWLLPLFLNVYIASADCKRVDVDLQKYDDVLMEMKREFYKNTINPESVVWVTKKINHMYEVDQYMRLTFQELPFKQKYTKEEKECFYKAFKSRWDYIDTTNTEGLKLLMDRYTWFWISTFGEDINQKAWNLVQHSDHDRPFQKRVLTILENASPIGQVKKSHYAFLYDRVTWYGDQKPQRYGTQGYCPSPGNWQPWPTEDFLDVNKRRASMGMEPIEQNKAVLDKVCH